MAVTFLDVEKGHSERKNSNVELSKYNSAAPTLNNTPNGSRDPSPTRKKKTKSRSPTPSPKQEDLEAMDSQLNKHAAQLTSYSTQELDVAYMGNIIIACFFTSGLIDAVAFNSWNCFVGMQTGNTVFAALGLGGLPQSSHSQQFVKSFIAIGSFCVGTLFFNILHRFPTGLHNQASSRRRIIFVLSFVVQASLIIVAAALVTSGVVSTYPFIPGTFSSGSPRLAEGRHWFDVIPIIILSFEAAGQVCLSRVLSLIELPTIVLSTLYHDYVADTLTYRQLWRQSSSVSDFLFVQGRRQNKRLASIIALFLGGVVGGEMYKSKAGMAGALWLAAAIKCTVAVVFAFWKKEKSQDEGDLEK